MPVDRALETLIRLGLAEPTTRGDLKRAASSGGSPQIADDGAGSSRQLLGRSSASEGAEAKARLDAETLRFDEGVAFEDGAKGEESISEIGGEASQGDGTGSKTDGLSAIAEPERSVESSGVKRKGALRDAASAEFVQADSDARAESSDGPDARTEGLDGRTESADGRTEDGTTERNGKDAEMVYRAIRTGDAMPGLERRWLGLLMRPSVWALNKETH